MKQTLYVHALLCVDSLRVILFTVCVLILKLVSMKIKSFGVENTFILNVCLGSKLAREPFRRSVTVLGRALCCQPASITQDTEDGHVSEGDVENLVPTMLPEL